MGLNLTLHAEVKEIVANITVQQYSFCQPERSTVSILYIRNKKHLYQQSKPVTMQMPIYAMRNRTSFSRLLMTMIIAFLALMSSVTATAQLTGTKNIPGDYATLAAAI